MNVPYFPNLSIISVLLRLQRRYIEIRKLEASTQQFCVHRSLAHSPVSRHQCGTSLIRPFFSSSPSIHPSWPATHFHFNNLSGSIPASGKTFWGKEGRERGNSSSGGSFLSSPLSRLGRVPRRTETFYKNSAISS